MGEAFMSYHQDPWIREYQDRGMAKWLGFYLSEHTAEMGKEKQTRETTWQHQQQMTDLEISEVLETAFFDHQLVTLQLSTLDEQGQAFPDLTGTIEGMDETTIFLGSLEGDVQFVQHDSIYHASLISNLKWSDVS
ncbi:hypothetical protein [Enterococcus sp. HY326]|uniref:hypothetical protein n=1 Tax=Enterococcus sp. HY326 TaxID=2971265 RepID=UPI00223FD22F|nr:hypothetical protein [Enterococcus sp. HY326]